MIKEMIEKDSEEAKKEWILKNNGFEVSNSFENTPTTNSKTS